MLGAERVAAQGALGAAIACRQPCFQYYTRNVLAMVIQYHTLELSWGSYATAWKCAALGPLAQVSLESLIKLTLEMIGPYFLPFSFAVPEVPASRLFESPEPLTLKFAGVVDVPLGWNYLV